MKSHISRIVVAVLAFAVAACGAAPEQGGSTAEETSAEETSAEETSGEEAGVITGFASVPWGTPMAELVAARGQPEERAGMGGGVVGVMYSDTVLGRLISVLFNVHPELGLVSGSYIARFPDGASCELIYQQWYQNVSARYPTLPATDVSPRGAAGSCDEAVRSGAGWKVTVWDDGANGARATLIVPPPAQAIVLNYHSEAQSALDADQRQRQF